MMNTSQKESEIDFGMCNKTETKSWAICKKYTTQVRVGLSNTEQ